MACEHIRVVVPAPVEAPRGAELAASAVVWILRIVLQGASWLRRQSMAPGRGQAVGGARIPHRHQLA